MKHERINKLLRESTPYRHELVGGPTPQTHELVRDIRPRGIYAPYAWTSGGHTPYTNTRMN